MASSRPQRKRHSTTFFRDEQAEEKPPTRRSLPAAAPRANANTPTDLPEVLYAPDGRKFYPCTYCCKAFAFKKAQISHIRFCSVRDGGEQIEVTTPKKQKAHTSDPESLLTPIKFEVVTVGPEVKLPKKLQQQINKKQGVKRKTTNHPQIAPKRIKQEPHDATMPVLKPMTTIPKTSNNKKVPAKQQQINKSVTERMKTLGSVSLIPIKKSPATKKPPSSSSSTIDIDKPTCCKQCKQIFSNAYECLKHKQKDHMHGSTQMSPDSLNVYNKIFLSSDRRFCPICMKPTKASSWNRHLITHSAQKNFRCDFCFKHFHRRDHLKNHLTTHFKERGMGEL